jgi:hypothetical protein
MGGTRFFNKTHIRKIMSLKNLLKENGKRNHSLDLASKIISDRKHINYPTESSEIKIDYVDSSENLKIKRKIRLITNNLKSLLNY